MSNSRRLTIGSYNNQYLDENIPNNQIWYTSKNNSVISLRAAAFWGGVNVISNTYQNGRGVITFDGEITSISGSTGIYVFNDDNLNTITLPDSLTVIGEWVFKTRLAALNIPKNVETIKSKLDVDELTFESNIMTSKDYNSNGSNFFYTNCEIKKLILTPNVSVIGAKAFSYCDFELVLPETDLIFKGAAFEYSTIPSVTVEDNISIAKYTFMYYRGDVILRNTALVGKNYTYKNNYDISCNRLIIGDNIGKIGDYSLDNASPTEIIISDSVTSIGNYAFPSQDYEWTGITMSNNIKSIGDNCFRRHNVKEFRGKFASEDGKLLIINNVVVGAVLAEPSYIIPEGVTEIGGQVFSYSNLNNIDLPKSLEKINESAFQASTGLTSITSKAIIAPSINSNSLGGVGDSGILYYPTGSDYSGWLNILGTGWTGSPITIV